MEDVMCERPVEFSEQYTAHVNRDEQGFDRYLAVQGWFNNML